MIILWYLGVSYFSQKEEYKQGLGIHGPPSNSGQSTVYLGVRWHSAHHAKDHKPGTLNAKVLRGFNFGSSSNRGYGQFHTSGPPRKKAQCTRIF